MKLASFGFVANKYGTRTPDNRKIRLTLFGVSYQNPKPQTLVPTGSQNSGTTLIAPARGFLLLLFFGWGRGGEGGGGVLKPRNLRQLWPYLGL